MSTIDSSVTTAVTGAVWTLVHATGARLRPISATIVPVTTGGIATSIQCTPILMTTRPTSASSRPVIITPPSATAIPPWALAAAIGARKAKLEPR